MKFFKKLITAPIFSPITLFICTAIFSLLYVFMEWTYIITKPSALSASIFSEKALILFNSASVLSVMCLLIFIPYFILNKVIKSLKAKRVLRTIFAAIPAFLFTTMILLLIDNITYNLWKIGIVTSAGIVRGLYTAGFVLLFLFMLTRVIIFTNKIEMGYRKESQKTRLLQLVIFFAVLLALFGLPVITNPNLQSSGSEDFNTTGTTNRPNILLITVDSLNAEKMSMYGYSRQTTPFLNELAKSSLVGENHFTNAQGTIGALTALLTGKDPADNRVLASADILRGVDAYQHLPGILKKAGYDTAQLSYSYYADAGNLNIQDGFDLANSETSTLNPISSALSKALPTDNYYFLREISYRSAERLGHIFFIRDMQNPYKQMTESPEKFNDAYKLETALSLLRDAQKPLFIDIHWMGTHGPKYYPATQVFSAGKDPKTQGSREEAFYLDSILEFDTSFAQFYNELDKLGILDNTVVIITADHAQRWSMARLPLVVHFPGENEGGKASSNTETLDIAPTLLDYLKLPQPDWMPGQSLLQTADPNRPIFVAQIADSKKDPGTGKISYPDPVSPFYQFGKMSVLVCDTWYQLNLETLKLTHGLVKSHSGECPSNGIDSKKALELIKSHLDTYGFDTSSLQNVVVSK